MEINAGDSFVNISTTYTPTKVVGSAENTDIKAAGAESVSENNKRMSTEEREMSKAEIEKTTGDMNKIMQLLHANLKFSLHEETQRLMVQLVDIKDNKVLKEFPPHQLLDTLAAIREYVGILLDKKV
ncbi:flagellar protein FlaG [Sporomusa aerivorans]|uniref:flagellar protein FlaG n=1 Tax=Sporomusa aerivorans TaxID=204936 RepID=UPI00352AA68B